MNTGLGDLADLAGSDRRLFTALISVTLYVYKSNLPPARAFDDLQKCYERFMPELLGLARVFKALEHSDDDYDRFHELAQDE